MEFLEAGFGVFLLNVFWSDAWPGLADTVMEQAMTSISARRKLEDHWRARLREAQERYESATAAYRALLGEHGDGGGQRKDGYLARARRAEAEALAEYTRVLHIFTELTLRGGTPPETPATPEQK